MNEPEYSQDSERAVTRIWNMILSYAIRDGAREIHIEPEERQILVRFLIQGALHEQVKMPHYVMKPLIERIQAWMDGGRETEEKFTVTLQSSASGREREVRIRGKTLRLPEPRSATERPLAGFTVAYHFVPTISYSPEGESIIIKVETQLSGT
jgi:hypothetical protein